VEPGDVVILHDPQSAGLAPAIGETGAASIWSCHVGVDEPDDRARAAWAFLRPYVDAADAAAFSRPAYVWEGYRGTGWA
jgi:trehalose synthase